MTNTKNKYINHHSKYLDIVLTKFVGVTIYQQKLHFRLQLYSHLYSHRNIIYTIQCVNAN